MASAAKLTLLAALVCVACVPCLAAPAAVPATAATHASSWLTAVVVDLVDTASSYPNHRAGWRAAEWAQLALTKADRWNLVPRARVRTAAAGLPLTGPLPSTADLQRLADATGANLIVTGTLRSLTLDAHGPSVAADLRLEVIDASTGETVVTGVGKATVHASRADPEPTDVLVEDALHRAVDLAAAQLLAAKPASGTVLARTGDQQIALGFPKGVMPKTGECVLIVRTDNAGGKAVIAVAKIRKATRQGISALVVAQTDAPRLDDVALVP